MSSSQAPGRAPDTVDPRKPYPLLYVPRNKKHERVPIDHTHDPPRQRVGRGASRDQKSNNENEL
jgi:hypothetical protein